MDRATFWIRIFACCAALAALGACAPDPAEIGDCEGCYDGNLTAPVGLSATPLPGTIELSWQLPADPGAAGVMLRRSQAGPVNRTTDGDLVFQGVDSVFYDGSVVKGPAPYFYGLFAWYPEKGVYSAPIQAMATLGNFAVGISAGNAHSCAILDNLSFKCWGLNQDGQLGLGDTTSRGDNAGEMGDALPTVQLGSGAIVSTLSLGSFHPVRCWKMVQ